MSILSKFTVKPLLIAIAILGLALVASNLYAYKLRADVSTAEAALKVSQGETATARGERDAAATRAGELATAAHGWQAIAGERLVLLQAAQAEAQRQREAGDQAVAKARAAERDAARTLGTFMRTYQIESRKPDCERARNAMAAACPALKDY